MISSFRTRVAFLSLATIVVFAGVFLSVRPFPQPPDYHEFVDTREFFRSPNMLNVVSNLPFLVVGIWGLMFMAGSVTRRPGVFLEPCERWPFWVYFVGLALTGIGSAYYHSAPDNERLFWDRLPLMVTFMGLFTAVLAERVYVKLAIWLLAPLVALAASSVVYWDWTERAAAGDLRFYLMMQFYPIVALFALIVLFPPRYTRTVDLIASLAAYGVAKALEILDGRIYQQGGFVSGHTLKHLVAGLGAYLILHMLQRRQPVEQLRSQG